MNIEQQRQSLIERGAEVVKVIIEEARKYGYVDRGDVAVPMKGLEGEEVLCANYREQPHISVNSSHAPMISSFAYQYGIYTVAMQNAPGKRKTSVRTTTHREKYAFDSNDKGITRYEGCSFSFGERISELPEDVYSKLMQGMAELKSRLVALQPSKKRLIFNGNVMEFDEGTGEFFFDKKATKEIRESMRSADMRPFWG